MGSDVCFGELNLGSWQEGHLSVLMTVVSSHEHQKSPQ